MDDNMKFNFYTAKDRGIVSTRDAGSTEFILARMIARDFRPDTYTFASVLITYQRTPNDKLDATFAADDAVARGMESLHLQGK